MAFNIDLVDLMTEGNQTFRTRLVNAAFPTAKKGYPYIRENARGIKFERVEIIAQMLHVSLDQLSTVMNSASNSVSGNNNNVNMGNVNVNTDLSSENRTLKFEIANLKAVIQAKEETITAKDEALSAKDQALTNLTLLCKEKGIRLEETTFLYEKSSHTD